MGNGEHPGLFACSVSVALHRASRLPIEDTVIADSVDPARWPEDALFVRAWRATLAELSPRERVSRFSSACRSAAKTTMCRAGRSRRSSRLTAIEVGGSLANGFAG